ncbi:ArsR/SmtB family transcription factor [Romboutsia sp.]|uniref:ArsR/SmtB family transcription factor n=1 Tax=Romboutsia sp. TaxID=1965302 RepID=UPI003F33C489
MKEVLVLRDLECIKAIAHPRRIDILKTFDKSPLSAKQLSQLLDEPHAKINYHIKTLYKVGILELVEEKIKSGIVEKYYYPKAKNIVIAKSVINFSLNNSQEEKQELCISKFEDIVELFYQAAEEDLLESENILDYHDVYLTQSELVELNNEINIKVQEILSKRVEQENDIKYDIAIVSVPIAQKQECSI